MVSGVGTVWSLGPVAPQCSQRGGGGDPIQPLEGYNIIISYMPLSTKVVNQV